MASFRRSHQSTSTYPDFDLRFENRNSEDAHNAALDASYADRLRVNEAARRAHELYEARQHQLRLRELAIQEEERVRLEEERVREEIRLREIENRARQIPKIPARVPTPPPPAPVQDQKPAATLSTQPAPVPNSALEKPSPEHQPSTQAPITQPSKAQTNQPINPFAQAPTQASSLLAPQSSQPSSPSAQRPSQPSNLFAQQPSQPSPQLAAAAPVQKQPTPATSAHSKVSSAHKHPFLLEGVDRYAEIHKTLKQMRKFVNNAGDADKQLKKTVGELRRTLRMSIGQIVKDKRQNKEPLNKIVNTLEQALKLTQHLVDPSMFMLFKPEPCEGAVHNGDQMPMIFIFLLNFFAKYIISQFINEAGVNPEIADPIGVIAVHIFAREQFLWRGRSLIDILMAKMRVACPVVFGVRGNEGTEQGRASLGWTKDESGSYISEEMHGGRMTGLAAGYAAICLRDFSKSKLKNPWHPTHYWQSIASIVATPPSERSITQYLVLRSMIDGYEATFLRFYGNAARAALVIALVKFPAGASAPDSAVDAGSGAVGGVRVLADKLARGGIELRV